ncbi:helix-turn-helix transcriptional regulator [Microvirga sp. 2TAF3]|uniref:helix-turn-helix transcriptional regulator n=1 Tax=Microvirga sp. 2TAF3 TaxID=3233014 RepID=UPI003F9C0CFB
MSIFDALGFGSILLGDGRRVLNFNRHIQQHFGAGLTVQSGYLSATDAKSDRILQGVLAAHFDGIEKPRGALGLHRAELRPLILRILSLGENIRSALGGARLIAIVVDPEYCPEPMPELLPQVFGLTKKETQVAIQLMCGNTLQEIAQNTGIGLGTIRTQTKAILAKTETKRQAELVGLLTRLAVVSAQMD